ncbi:Molybdopterin-synthase adenylyltransferase [Pseudomonas chlororaphis]|nr:molybdopterin-synthase adenylyltransferase MoeB [Pseudomonas chlororaphis]AZD30285.1 Molybdopterin-synthase adenylyltransferase [Pseudomonas chlororaphis]ETD39640.1 molybdenum cofactor biosynthesis protein MoeB [Pseudomonas chlororaphis subsp. aurantiaca PB-St2]
MKEVIFPAVLVRVAKLAQNNISGHGTTVREVISNICDQHAALRAHLFYDNDQLKEHFLLTSQGRLVDPDTPLSSGEKVEIMLATSGGSDTGDLSNEEIQRYVRHITLPGVGRDGQLRLKQAKVLIIGTGGLGSPISLYLAAAGVGTLGLVDFDIVESSNLQRQIVHGYSTLGMPKVESAKLRLLDLNPYIDVRTHICAVDQENACNLIEQYDLVVDGTDNFASRYIVNDICVRLNKPLVFGAIYRFDGQVSVFNVNGGPCYRCLFPKSPPSELSPSCSAGGVIGVLPGVVGLVQATEAVKLILQMGEPLSGRMLRFDALSMKFDEIQFERRSNCATCSPSGSTDDVMPDQAFVCDSIAEFGKQLDSRQYIAPQELQQALTHNAGDISLLDVRDANELEVCSLPGIVHIPLNELRERINELDVHRRYVVVCYAGTRAEHAAKHLAAAGFDDIQILDGGMKRWARDVERNMPMY